MDCQTKKYLELSEKYEKLSARLTPELMEAEKLSGIVQKLRLEEGQYESSISARKKEIDEIEGAIRAAKASLLVASDAVEMESFGLYRPRYEFARSEDYKDRLAECRETQKQLIRDKSAAIYQEGWSVNGSASAGKKLQADMAKLFIRAFNLECDSAVKDVKFSNFDKSQERIQKAFDSINALGKINGMAISKKYQQLKIDELTLAYEYQCKKQEEKEEIQALRERQREDAKAAKELEAARKEAEKEKKHYILALEKLDAQAANCKSEAEKAEINQRRNEIEGYMDDLNKRMEDIDYRQENQRAGYVYVISNVGSFGENVYKIGMTRRFDPMERVYELGDASVPFRFDVHAMIFSQDAPALEAALHRAFSDKRLNLVNPKREYFRVSLEEIKKVVRENHDKTVEFIDSPDAQQYRESMLLRAASGCRNLEAKPSKAD